MGGLNLSMNDTPELNELQFHLLSSQADGPEPLFVLYYETVDTHKGVTLDEILHVLVWLVKQGYSAYDIRPPPRNNPGYADITFEELKKRFEGLSEKERREYPRRSEYYFRLTAKGRKENENPAYEKYYLDAE